jgi:beta-N-acetylhexosaminidase
VAVSAPDARSLLMLAFDGLEVPPWFATRLRDAPVAGITLFRYLNVDAPGQVRELTASVQRAAAERPGSDGLPILVAADHEGGQMLALGTGATPFAGNMALGAAGDEALAERVGRAMGLEAAAMGVNVVYAPVCDLATNPRNPGIGIRSFGDEPIAAAKLVAAVVRGLRSSGVAACAKHYPGLGEAAVDSHHVLPIVNHDRHRLDSVELVPFRTALAAGAELVMSAHVAIPAITGDPALPATLSPAVLAGLLRADLGPRGLAISDALDMAALRPGADGLPDAVAGLRAGLDLLLLGPQQAAGGAIEAALVRGTSDGALDAGIAASSARVDALRRRVAGIRQPALDIVGSREHRALARELAEASVTFVRDDAGLLPIRLASDARLGALMPRPRDLTPADTSSAVEPGLAAALRRHHDRVDEVIAPNAPEPGEIAGFRDWAAGCDLVVVGTIAASLEPAQAALVDTILATGVPVVTVALRTPYDLAAYPSAKVHAATYGILQPSLDALADALFGEIPFRGRLPVAVAAAA